MRQWWLVIFFFMIVGCQQKPTIGVTDSGVLIKPDYRKVVSEESVVFDTRSPFDFNMGKIPGSINLPVSDFNTSQDRFDAARRLSLYGVNPESSVVIVGLGHGDEQKLAWEFIKLGITNIETLNINVFKLMNLRPESPPKNVTIWKPDSPYDEIDIKSFHNKIEKFRPKPITGARADTFQNFPVAEALRKRVLIIASDQDWERINNYNFADHFVLNDQNFFDSSGLLNRGMLQGQKFGSSLKKYDVVFVIDSRKQKYANAYALVQFGAKSLFLIPKNVEN